MSSLARYYKYHGVKVSGYDKTETALTRDLQNEGMQVHYQDDIEKLDSNASMVIYTPAIPADNKELNYFRNNGYQMLKRSEALALVMEDGFNICVAGTHGKTTTSTMVAHILKASGYGCNAFLGGISSNYQTNFWTADNQVNVAEADEYDRSFLKLSPDIAVITSMDADHLDIYGTEVKMQEAFADFSRRIKNDGLLIYKYDMPQSNTLTATRKLSYDLKDDQADAYASNITTRNGAYTFDVSVSNKILTGFELNMGGLHNIENMVAAVTVAVQLNISGEKIKDAVASFTGVKRRFEFVTKSPNLVIIDDYAHHPAELQSLLQGVKDLYPERKCTVVFQPHLFSRTKDHAEGFASVLSKADALILLPIYPARELPVEGVSSHLILDKVTIENKRMLEKEALIPWLSAHKPEVLVMCGAGDIDVLVDPVRQALENIA